MKLHVAHVDKIDDTLIAVTMIDCVQFQRPHLTVDSYSMLWNKYSEHQQGWLLGAF